MRGAADPAAADKEAGNLCLMPSEETFELGMLCGYWAEVEARSVY